MRMHVGVFARKERGLQRGTYRLEAAKREAGIRQCPFVGSEQRRSDGELEGRAPATAMGFGIHDVILDAEYDDGQWLGGRLAPQVYGLALVGLLGHVDATKHCAVVVETAEQLAVLPNSHN